MDDAGTLLHAALAQAAAAPTVAGWKQTAAVIMVSIGVVLLILSGVSMWRKRFRDPLAKARAAADVAPVLAAAGAPITVPASAPIASAGAGEPAPAALQEAQQLLELMNRAEDMVSRLTGELDRRAETARAATAQAESVIAKAEAAIARLEAATTAAERRISEAAAMPAMPVAPVAPMMMPPPAAEPKPELRPELKPEPVLMPVEPPRSSPSRLTPVVTIAPAMMPAGLTSVASVATVATPARAVTPIAAPAATVHSTPAIAAAPRPAAARGFSPAVAPVIAEPEVSEVDPLTAEIYRLADQGLSHIEVARRLNQHVGKVELILALRP